MRRLGGTAAVLCFALGMVIAMLAAGCSAIGMRGAFLEVEGAAQATWIVWHDTYRREDKPPKVRWVTGGDLDCTQHPSGISGFHTVVGCRGGFTLSPLEVSVALHDGEQLSDTPLAHEFAHAMEAREGVLDPLHATAPFTALDKCGTCVNAPPEPVESPCFPDPTGDVTCPRVDPGACGLCGIVDRANENLRRVGM